MAILMSKQLLLKDKTLTKSEIKLVKNIIKTQRKEIDFMKGI
jgi:uncharacterized protein (DUF305 family)